MAEAPKLLTQLIVDWPKQANGFVNNMLIRHGGLLPGRL